jgi:hypothetical protein
MNAKETALYSSGWFAAFIIFIVGSVVCYSVAATYSQHPNQHASEHHSESDNGPSAAIPSPKGDDGTATIKHGEEKEFSKWSDPITWFTFGLLVVGASQCVIYWKQKGIMELSSRGLELAERAELQITMINFPPSSVFDNLTRIQVTFKNFGRTVATDIIANVRFHDMVSATAATTPCIVAPTNENSFNILLTQIGPALTADDFRGFNSGTKLLRFVIEISFTDIFEKRVTTIYDAQWDVLDRGVKYTSIRRK